MNALVSAVAALAGSRRGSPWPLLGWGVLCVFMLVGIGFLIAAGYIALATVWAPAWAAATMGGGLLGAGVVAIALERLQAARSRAARRRQQAALADNAQDIAALLSAEVKDNPYEAVILAMVAGALVGASPEVRAGLMDALR